MADLYTPENIRVGFRFKRDQRKVLANTAEQMEALGQFDAVSLFRSAAHSAAMGEPLIVEAKSIAEARALAEGFGRHAGVRIPSIEELQR